MKILIVSLGNICSSPFAAGILKLKFKKMQIDGLVASAGFESFNINEPASEQITEFAKEKGIDLSKHKCRLFKTEDFDKFDKIFAVDSASYRDIQFFSRSEEDIKKVKYLLSVIDGKNRSLPKLFLEGRKGLEKMYDLVKEACDIIANQIIK